MNDKETILFLIIFSTLLVGGKPTLDEGPY